MVSISSNTCFRVIFLLWVISSWQSSTLLGQNILFYGNSFTNGLGSTDSVPNVVRDIAVAAGRPAPTIQNAAVNGRDFVWHLANNTSVISTALTSGETWDYAILQNFSTAPTHLGNLAQHRTDSVTMYQEIANHSPNFIPILFETWARAPGHSFYTGESPNFPGGPSEMQAEVRNGYRLASQDIDAVAGLDTSRIAEVGDRWEDASWNNLHSSDLYHAQNRGTLLSALEIYSTIYTADTAELDLSGVLSHLGLDAADGLFLKSIVDGTTPDPPEDVILKFDVGSTSHSNPNYNTISWAAHGVSNAIDFDTGMPSGISLSTTSSTGFNELGPNSSGTTSPGSPANDFFDGEATSQNLFGHDSNFNAGSPRPLVEYTISGLTSDRQYDFAFFASRLEVADNRETQYELTGVNSETVFLNPSENTDEVATALGIWPTLDGEIILSIQKGPNNDNSDGFFYLGAMEIATVDLTEDADFDKDGDIDGADFLKWQRDGLSSAELTAWKKEFGINISQSVTASAVPEPSSLLIGLTAALVLFLIVFSRPNTLSRRNKRLILAGCNEKSCSLPM